MGLEITKTGRALLVREADEEDAEELVKLFNQMGGESDNLTFGYNDYYLNDNQQRLLIKAMRERRNTLFIIGKINNSIVGYLTLTTMQKGRLNHRGEIGIAILKERWGEGIGSLLFKYMMNWVDRNGYVSKLELQVRVDNHNAVALYKKWGFEIEGTIKKGMKIEEEYFDIYYMGKFIGR